MNLNKYTTLILVNGDYSSLSATTVTKMNNGFKMEEHLSVIRAIKWLNESKL
jgi:hypothetical protein